MAVTIPHTPLAIVGPTAAGKTALSLALCHLLAERYGVRASVVNMDAMQLYRGMDIGTAKLTPSQREGIDHYLLDIWDVTETASVATYQHLAVDTVTSLLAQSVVPVLVGGSMLYYQSLIDNWQFPPTDPAVRKRLNSELDTSGLEPLWHRLQERDPHAAEIIQPHDERRIIRALEVMELTGQPFTASQPDRNGAPRWDTTIIGLATSPDWLNPRIDERTRRMFEAGLVEETRRLVAAGLTPSSTAGRAIGYAQVLAMDAGELSAEEAVEATIVATRRYVRRQRAWFKRDPRIVWYDAATVATDPLGTAQQILQNRECRGPN